MAGMRTLLAAVLTALVLTAVLPPPGAHACSCIEPQRGEVAAWFEEADGAFVGRPTSKAEPTPGPNGSWSSDQLVDMAFEVESVAKGQIGPVLVLQTQADGASCGVEGSGRMAVLVRGSEEVGWRSDLCSVVPVDVLAAVADLHPPSPSSSPPPEAPSPPPEARDTTPETSRAPGMPLVPVVAGLALLALVGLLVVRSRTR